MGDGAADRTNQYVFRDRLGQEFHRACDALTDLLYSTVAPSCK
jgi:hypothetical protein